MTEATGLFKYFTTSKLEFFEELLVLLTPAKYLNDPWDFRPMGRVATEEEILKEWSKSEQEIERTSLIALPAGFAWRSKLERLNRTRKFGTSKDYFDRLPAYSQELHSRLYGIVSLTENPLCRLMWAHYAGSHTGFVAEFAASQERFERHGLTFRTCSLGPVVAGQVSPACAAKVKYPRPFKPGAWTADNIVELSCTKHPLWEYEQEWRILYPLQESFLWRKECKDCHRLIERCCLAFGPESLRRVIFGMRMQFGMKQRLSQMLSREDFKHVQKQTTDIDPRTGELILKSLERA